MMEEEEFVVVEEEGQEVVVVEEEEAENLRSDPQSRMNEVRRVCCGEGLRAKSRWPRAA